MLKKQLVRAIGGLNTDDDPRYLAEGDYLEMLNMRVGSNQEQGDRGLIETFLSHYRIEFPGVTPSTFTVLCAAKEDEFARAYILAHEGTGSYFQIYRFETDTDAITLIYQAAASLWNITQATKIYNPRVLDGKLVWTDNVNPIKYVDVARLETSYLNGIGLTPMVKWDETVSYAFGVVIYWQNRYYRSLQESNINHQPDTEPTWWLPLALILNAYGDISDPNNFNLAASPPLLAAEPVYINTAGREANNLRQKTFQVTYRYVYIDYRKSTYAPPSIVPAPDQEETIDGLFNPTQTYHNGLTISINTGNEEVRSIEIVGRSSEDPAAWFIMGEVLLFDRDGNRNVNPESSYVFNWYNDSAKQIVDATLIYTLFTYVPIRAKHLELIEGNRLAIANLTEGYDRIQPFVHMEVSYEDLTGLSTEKEGLSVTPVITGYSGIFEALWQLKFELPSTQKYGLYKIRIVPPNLIPFEAQFNYTTGAYPLTVKNGLIAAINAAGWAYAIQACSAILGETGPSDYKICFFQDATHGIMDVPFENWQYNTTCYREVPAVIAVNKYPALKDGASHSWGIVYRDIAGRISPIIGAGEIVKYLPFPTETAGMATNQRAIIDFYINHLPPDWAESYEFVYAGNRTVSWFLQLLAYNITWGKAADKHDVADPYQSRDNRVSRVSLEDMYARTREKLPSWAVEQYVWEKGDRIRIIGVVDSLGVLSEISFMFDAEIIGVFTDTDWISGIEHTEIERAYLYFQNDGWVGLTLPDISRYWSDVLVEIYRPYKEFSTTIFHTTGMTFPVAVDAYGHKYHKGDTDQVLNSAGQVISAAIVRNKAHDVWKHYRNFSDKMLDVIHHLWVENMYCSDFYVAEKLTSSGLPIPDLNNFKQTILTKRIRHGGLYNFGTELNNIAKFDYDDFKDVKDEHGPIEGLREVGFILKIIQYNKITAIYLSRQESFTASGQAQYLFTDKVFGSLRPGMEKYGTRHPGSVIVHNEHLYFWDQAEGAVIRDAANGAFPISKYKMTRFFIDKARELAGAGFNEDAVEFAYNVHDDTLHCTFFNGTAYETLMFSELDQRWKYSSDAKIRRPFWFGKRLFHTADGAIYEWWREAELGYLRLSNVQKTARLVIAFAEDSMKVKYFKALAVYQTGATPIASVLVPAKGSAVARDMQTIVANWEREEGIYYGQLLRDINTPGLTGDNNKYMNGIRLRGEYCIVTLDVTESNEVVRIFNAMMTTTDSERSL